MNQGILQTLYIHTNKTKQIFNTKVDDDDITSNLYRFPVLQTCIIVRRFKFTIQHHFSLIQSNGLCKAMRLVNIMDQTQYFLES